MKWLTKTLVASTLAFLLAFGAVCHRKPAQYNPITPQRKATHMIQYYGEDTSIDKAKELCTGTAVGPHAILTALHCDEGEFRTVRLDWSQTEYHITGVKLDGRDHIIYLLDGPAFKNVVTIHEREAVMGEPVISYGDGEQDYPQHTYSGFTIEAENGGDTSELDAAQGTHFFSLGIVAGDSGSAIYGLDGSIVALASLGNGQHAIGFALAFSPEQLEAIKQ
jgi:hypothetical protein